MAKKLSTQEKFEKAFSDIKQGKAKDIEQACKVHRISPATYHNYKNKMGLTKLVKGPQAATMTTTSKKKTKKTKVKEDSSYNTILNTSLKAENNRLQEKVVKLTTDLAMAEAKISQLKEKIISLV